jgi:Mrp family chromosome partitioning ATPase
LFILGEAAASPRLRSVPALEQTANLPLLGDLGDLDKMSLQDRKSWAFFTFARLRQRLGQSKNAALVCGFTSSGFGEGKSTWVNLLAEAATRQGYPVLVISAGLSDLRATAPAVEVQSAESGNSSEAILVPSRFPQVPKLPAGRLTVPISALGWVWSMEGRSHWNEAVRHLDGLENQIVLVDLPPASQPETHLLAKSLPNVIWVCARGVANAPETRAQLDSLADLGAKVVGVVMNK